MVPQIAVVELPRGIPWHIPEVSKDSHGLEMCHIISCGPSERIHTEAEPGNNFFSWSDTCAPWWWPCWKQPCEVVTSHWEFSFRQIFLGYLHPKMRLGIPPSSLTTPWGDSGRANTDSCQPPRSTELPTSSKPGWWEKGKAPLGLPCALREDCRCISRVGHPGQAGAAQDPLDRHVQR